MSDSEVFEVVTPVRLDSGNTTWFKVGAYIVNDDKSKKYQGSFLLTGLPLGTNGPITCYVFKREEGTKPRQVPRGEHDFGPPPRIDIDEDVPY